MCSLSSNPFFFLQNYQQKQINVKALDHTDKSNSWGLTKSGLKVKNSPCPPKQIQTSALYEIGLFPFLKKKLDGYSLTPHLSKLKIVHPL